MSVHVLVGGVQDVLLYLGTLLVVEQSEVVGVLAHVAESAEGVSKSVADGYSFQASQKTFVVSGLGQYLMADGGSILTAVALPKHEEGTAAGDTQFVETAVGTGVQLFEGCVEIGGEFVHAGDVGFVVGGVCVAESCSDGLVNEEDVVGLGPCPFVSGNVVGFVLAFADSEGTQLK